MNHQTKCIPLNTFVQKNAYERKLIIPQSNLKLRYLPQSNFPQTRTSLGLPVWVGTGRRRRGTATARRLPSVVHRVTLDGTEAFVTFLFVVAADFDRGCIGWRGLMIVRARGIPSWVCKSRADKIVQIDRHRERGRPALVPLLRDADAVRRAALVLARRVPRAVGYAATINGGRDVHAGCARAHHPWIP